MNFNLRDEDLDMAHQKDLHHLAKQCQSHTHSATCYKYWKGPPEPKECHFDLDENNVQLQSSFNSETGEICLRCLDGLVNNFNATILEAVRCNMDIKFIGSGASAKAILYYITDYITKSQLKAYVVYAALELAVGKLGEYNSQDDNLTVHAKRLLQKCAYLMISHQELSAQQVCSYLLDYEDHFTSHKYNNLYWTSFEKLIDDEDPSPSCYSQKQVSTDNTDPENESDSDELDRYHSGKQDENEKEVDIDKENENENDSLETDEHDEICISVKQTGEIVAKANQVVDYQLRGDCLNNISVWIMLPKLKKYLKHLIIKNQMIKMIARMMKMMTHLIPNLKVILQRPLKKF